MQSGRISGKKKVLSPIEVSRCHRKGQIGESSEPCGNLKNCGLGVLKEAKVSRGKTRRRVLGGSKMPSSCR